MVQVVPVVTSQVDWNSLLLLSGRGLGRSLSKSVDAQKWQLSEMRSGVAALAEFQKSDSSATATLRDPGSLLRHFMVSFFVLANKETFYEIALEGTLKVLDCESDELAIVSATLEDWRATVVRFCSPRATQRQREFHSACLGAFDKMGLSALFDNYSRRGPLLLEKR